VSVKLNEKRGYWLIDTIWPDGVRTRTKMPDALHQRGAWAPLDRLYQKALRQVQSRLSIKERSSGAGRTEIEARMTLAPDFAKATSDETKVAH
jgi:hypothetical protein